MQAVLFGFFCFTSWSIKCSSIRLNFLMARIQQAIFFCYFFVLVLHSWPSLVCIFLLLISILLLLNFLLLDIATITFVFTFLINNLQFTNHKFEFAHKLIVFFAVGFGFFKVLLID